MILTAKIKNCVKIFILGNEHSKIYICIHTSLVLVANMFCVCMIEFVAITTIPLHLLPIFGWYLFDKKKSLYSI
jgi:hypothetical protein